MPDPFDYLFLLFCGLCSLYLCVLTGNTAHVVILSNIDIAGKFGWLTILLCTIGALSAFITGLIFTRASLRALWSYNDGTKIDDQVVLRIIGLVLPGFSFGIIAAPFESFGPNPFHWFSPWILLPFFGLVPVAIMLKRILFGHKQLE